MQAVCDGGGGCGMASSCVERLQSMVVKRDSAIFVWRPCCVGAANDTSPEARGEGDMSADGSYSSRKIAWSAQHFGQLKTAGMVINNSQATCLSVATAVPNGSRFDKVADYQVVNRIFKQAAMPIPRSE